MNIHKVPTFIFYKNGKEINRIVESPHVSLEQDFKAILDGKHTPKYAKTNLPEKTIKERD